MNPENSLADFLKNHGYALDNIPFGIIIADFFGNIHYVNTAFTKLLGYTIEDVPNQDVWFEKAYRSDKQKIIDIWQTDVDNRFRDDVSHRFLVYCKDDSTKIIEFRASVINNCMAAVFLVDVTKTQQMEEALTKSEKRYRLFADNTIDIIWTCDLNMKFDYLSQSVERIMGFTPEEVMQRAPVGTLTPRSLQIVSECLGEELAKEQKKAGTAGPRTMILEQYKKDGSTIWTEVTANFMRDADGHILGVAGVTRDITGRKAAEDAVLDTMAKYQAIVDGYDGLIYICSEDYTVEFMNRNFIERTGKNAVGEKCFKALHNLDTVCPWCVNDRVFKNEVVKWEMKSPLDERWYYVVNSPIHHTDGTVSKMGLIQDITERKNAHDTLAENERILSTLMNNLPGMAYRVAYDEQFTIKYLSEGCFELTGYTIEELMRKPRAYAEIIVENDRRKVGSAIRTAVASKEQYIIEYRIVTRNGKIKHVWEKGIPIFKDKKADSLEGFISDITMRKEAEKLILEEKERLSVTLRNIGDGIITTDSEGSIVLMNSIAEEITGLDLTQAYGKHVDSLISFYDEFKKIKRASLFEESKKIRGTVESSGHCLILRQDGQERFVTEKATPIIDTQSVVNGIIIVLSEVTDRRRMETEMMKSQKLESIAVLAGGIAHDFNNILTAIVGSISIAELYVKNDSEVYEQIQEIKKASFRARDLARQLLTFSKGGVALKKVAYIDSVVKDSVNFALRGSGVKCNFFISEGLYACEFDDSQISQVIHNLIINSVQAMNGSGIIEIRVENMVTNRNMFPYEYKKFVRIQIIDSGSGIDAEHLEKIFDPYFTTKEKGSGLGLSTSYTIIKNHGGYIFAESRPGTGATFNVYIPACDEKNVSDEKDIGGAFIAGSGKILCMDDEEIVRNTTENMLKKIGYEVMFAANGDEAVILYAEAFKKNEPFDVVVLDLTIPGGKGAVETLALLREIDPNVKAIVSTGYSADSVLEEYSKYGISHVVEKPYRLLDLSKALHSAMSA